jgi:NAD-dependent dihydropyrimidine dehydrogenase PreA subunit
MLRPILKIDRDLCNGCGQCVTACAEGAIQMQDGKAVVVKEEFCDGLGACIGECPTGALVIEQREAPEFDPDAVASHLSQLGRPPAPHAAPHGRPAMHPAFLPPADDGQPCGCPGSAVRMGGGSRPAPRPAPPADQGLPGRVQPSELTHWPVQLHLVPIRAPFFQDGRELVVLSTCAPVASADVHWRFLRGRSVVVACPKLDRTDPYVEKLGAIFASNPIPRVVVVRMEVPCCGGLVRIVEEARARSGRQDLVVDEVVVATDGEILGTRRLAA